MNSYLQEIQAHERVARLHAQAQQHRDVGQLKARWNWRKWFVSFPAAIKHQPSSI